LLLFYFPNRELLRCALLVSVVRELETIFLGGEVMGRCSTLVTSGIFGGCHTFLQTKKSMSIYVTLDLFSLRA